MRMCVTGGAGFIGSNLTLRLLAEGHTVTILDDLSSGYAENLATFEAVCLRYFNVFGPHQRYDAYGNVIPIFVRRGLRGDPLVIYGDGHQTRDFVHVNDVVQANIRSAAAPGVTGSFNIGSGSAVTV